MFVQAVNMTAYDITEVSLVRTAAKRSVTIR